MHRASEFGAYARRIDERHSHGVEGDRVLEHPHDLGWSNGQRRSGSGIGRQQRVVSQRGARRYRDQCGHDTKQDEEEGNETAGHTAGDRTEGSAGEATTRCRTLAGAVAGASAARKSDPGDVCHATVTFSSSFRNICECSTNHHVDVAVLIALAVCGLALFPAGAANAHSPTPTSTPSGVASLDACPVGGRSEFFDDFGDARSGGRRHQGVDMVADRGTPVVAVRDGAAEFKRSNLGGNAIWLVSASGERFYYAHLDRWEGVSRTVTAGEVIGYVGSSGNARGNHLHFESRAGDAAVNPYPLVSTACTEARG